MVCLQKAQPRAAQKSIQPATSIIVPQLSILSAAAKQGLAPHNIMLNILLENTCHSTGVKTISHAIYCWGFHFFNIFLYTKLFIL